MGGWEDCVRATGCMGVGWVSRGTVCVRMGAWVRDGCLYMGAWVGVCGSVGLVCARVCVWTLGFCIVRRLQGFSRSRVRAFACGIVRTELRTI